MPKIRQTNFHLRRIQSVATKILTGHQKLNWNQRTRETTGGYFDYALTAISKLELVSNERYVKSIHGMNFEIMSWHLKTQYLFMR